MAAKKAQGQASQTHSKMTNFRSGASLMIQSLRKLINTWVGRKEENSGFFVKTSRQQEKEDDWN